MRQKDQEKESRCLRLQVFKNFSISTIISLFIKKITLRKNEFLVSVDPELLTEVCVTEDDIFLIGLLSVNGVCRALGPQKHMGFWFIEVLC